MKLAAAVLATLCAAGCDVAIAELTRADTAEAVPELGSIAPRTRSTIVPVLQRVAPTLVEPTRSTAVEPPAPIPDRCGKCGMG